MLALSAIVTLLLFIDLLIGNISTSRSMASNIGQYIRSFGLVVTGILTIVTLIRLIAIDHQADQDLANAVADRIIESDSVPASVKKDATWRMIAICLTGLVAGAATVAWAIYPYLCS